MARFCEGNIGTSAGGLCLGMPGLEYNKYGCERCSKCATYVSEDWYGSSDDDSADNYDWDADDDYADEEEDED